MEPLQRSVNLLLGFQRLSPLAESKVTRWPLSATFCCAGYMSLPHVLLKASRDLQRPASPVLFRPAVMEISGPNRPFEMTPHAVSKLDTWMTPMQ